MAYDFSKFKEKTKEIEEWLIKEMTTLRTGRAASAILDSVRVDSYGSKMPINQVAGISVEDARTLRVSPWDKSLSKEIEKAITESNLGLSLVTDSNGLRIIFPELTSERRDSLVKILKDKLEESRISLRRSREEVWEDIQEKEKEGKMTEDDKFANKEKMQKIVDETQDKLEEIAKKKEQEIRA